MSDGNERNQNGTPKGTTPKEGQGKSSGRLSLRPAGRKDVGRTVEAGSVRQSFSHGRSKEVRVEVRKPKRSGGAGGRGGRATAGVRGLTASEQEKRQRVLAEAAAEAARREAEEEARREAEKIRIRSAAEEEARQKAEAESRRAQEEEEARSRAAEEEVRKKAEVAARRQEAERKVPPPLTGSTTGGVQLAEPTKRLRPLAERAIMPSRPLNTAASSRASSVRSSNDASETLHLRGRTGAVGGADDEGAGPSRRGGAGGARRSSPSSRRSSPRRSGGGGQDRRSGRIDVRAAIEGDDGKTRSLASVRRQRDRERRQAELERLRSDQVRVVRDVTVPETITVGELANRMAARQGEVIKMLMKMGVMATAAQSIDGDTAELVVSEFGHRIKRVADSDVELGIEGIEDKPEDMKPRPPVVTVMGHVDHGKTSLLDALRTTDVAHGEAGGITQHIGAYQVTVASGQKVTFIDTPGHEAFTSMRARGASVTDIVVLVVAADDGVMPQTIEAIKHAKAANAPIIVAINKMDKPGANPDRVRNELLNHEIVVESMGGDTQEVEVSALKRDGLDRLLEAILLQAEILDLKANPNRIAEGAVIESRLDRGRGSVATVLVQKGTLNRTDIVVAGAHWGRVRALLDDHGKQIKKAGPSVPVEILGMSGVPDAGAPFVVVDSENRAREISEFRQRKAREKATAMQVAARGTLDQMLARIQAGEQKEVALIVKADVQGSAEAIQATVEKLSHEEVAVRVLNASVGQITESDVQLAKASNAVIIAFNVRATVQARELAQRDGVDIRYYSIIYQVSDDVEKLVKGRIAPKHREKFLGYAEIRQVFNITKVGKVAGCYVTEGVVKRGCGVRLLRDNVVIHEGELSQLKRFKDDVREVAHNYECGLSFAGYNDLREGDVVECYEMEEIPA
ncbi:translation initiation factor IF-2 [Parasaccharibacter sp. TMW 2.1884]|uniref:translation initiation factor IF-2 n=1 Tax=Parasaccharibacter sp. TMW 2.1884 TaxID=2267834 RepID=UPI00131831AF|nr:translation initiation factor IF-2 [Parasaccharibacter sp. TMW 2.1884]MCL1510850.1 translation initiation factor IF-2 [Parasaccharibacter sp. TMW 2.1884]QGT74681.1 translation initiation factor IF-2 [Bombella sp. ESL0368]